MKKIYLLILMLISIFYWIIVLDQTEATGKPISLMMILVCLLIEILLINYLRKASYETPSRIHFLTDLLSGLEGLIFFSFVIKAVSRSGSFFESGIELQTFLFILMMSLLVVPITLRRKKKHQSIELKYVLLVIMAFVVLDRGLIYLELHHMTSLEYASSTIRFATSNLSILMYVTWIVNVEFIKKQFLHFND